VLRTLFSLHGRVNRRVYLVTGISLMLFKYVLDASAIYMVAHVVWTPWDYLIPLFSYRAAKIAVIPAGFALIFALWTLPFIWIGVTMMMKRAIDAGKSPAWCAFFLVPILNYAVTAIGSRQRVIAAHYSASRAPPRSRSSQCYSAFSLLAAMASRFSWRRLSSRGWSSGTPTTVAG
jgi:uncharacterized membrane protein YhaH (DUF805 family)